MPLDTEEPDGLQQVLGLIVHRLAGGCCLFHQRGVALRDFVDRALKSAGPWSFQAAVLDGVPGDPDDSDRNTIKLSSDEGALLIGQASYRVDMGVRVNAGYWRYTAEFDDVASMDATGEPRIRDDNAGAYVSIESPMLFTRGQDRGINLFARFGAAESRINPIARYIGGGAVYTGLFSPRDQAGIALAIAELGMPFRRAEASSGVRPMRASTTTS